MYVPGQLYLLKTTTTAKKNRCKDAFNAVLGIWCRYRVNSLDSFANQLRSSHLPETKLNFTSLLYILLDTFELPPQCSQDIPKDNPRTPPKHLRKSYRLRRKPDQLEIKSPKRHTTKIMKRRGIKGELSPLTNDWLFTEKMLYQTARWLLDNWPCVDSQFLIHINPAVSLSLGNKKKNMVVLKIYLTVFCYS